MSDQSSGEGRGSGPPSYGGKDPSPGGSQYPPPGGPYPPPAGQDPSPGGGDHPPPGGQYPPPAGPYAGGQLSYGSPPPSYGAPQHYPGGAWDGGEGASTGRNGFAIAAFCVGLLVPLLGLLIAVPLGIVALVKISGTRQRGKVLAILGMVLSVLWWVGVVVLAVGFGLSQVERNDTGEITEAGRIDFGDLRTGDCVSIDDPASGQDLDTFDLEGVPCADSHNLEVASVIALDGEDYPDAATIDDQSAQQCGLDVSALVGDRSGFQPYRLYPDEGAWDSDQDSRRVVCFVATTGFDDTTGAVTE